jgi:hypothetical protein
MHRNLSTTAICLLTATLSLAALSIRPPLVGSQRFIDQSADSFAPRPDSVAFGIGINTSGNFVRQPHCEWA